MNIDADRVAVVCQDPTFQLLTPDKGDNDREARIWAGAEILSHAIAVRRWEVLLEDSLSDRPPPYDDPALADLTPDDEHLVPLREFEFDGSRLVRNGHAFLMLSTTGAPHSTYWLLRSCYMQGLQEHVRVRLDPFLHGPVDSFHAMDYRMLVYGRPLDWRRVDRLRHTEHGRWYPGARSHSSEFTDFAWTPRREEVHFLCEEVPAVRASISQAGRYFHAVYLPSKASIAHLDAAMRIYSNSEVVARHAKHVRHAGKVGFREKVLRIDNLVARSVLSSICQAFFVWNEDVRQYFNVECAAVPTRVLGAP